MSTLNRTNQMWHYLGWVDTVSTVLKVQRATPIVRWWWDRIGLRIGGMSGTC